MAKNKRLDTRLSDLETAVKPEDRRGIVILWTSPLPDGQPGYFDNPDCKGSPFTTERIDELKKVYQDVILVDYIKK